MFLTVTFWCILTSLMNHWKHNAELTSGNLSIVTRTRGSRRYPMLVHSVGLSTKELCLGNTNHFSLLTIDPNIRTDRKQGPHSFRKGNGDSFNLQVLEKVCRLWHCIF